MTSNQRWRIKNHEKSLAHFKVENDKRAGRLKPSACEVCGATEKIHAHHDDYSKQDQVRWLCTSCHRKLHALLQGQHLRELKPKRDKNLPKFQPAPKRDALLVKAQEMRANGDSYKTIAKALQVSKGTAYKWLNDVTYS